MSGQSEIKQLDLETLSNAVANGGVAFRRRTRLQPAAGEGTKVFPPTYAGAVYATEKRRLPGRDDPVECVLLDSVQSQANRMEDALQQAVDEKLLTLPLVEVDFGPYFPGADQTEDMRLLDPVGRISSLQAPHRIADAILRDSSLNGEDFRKTEIGKRIGRASATDATALFEYCPTALLLGMWDSTGPKGGLGAKFERAIVSEVVGIDAEEGVRTSSRIDPLGVQLKAGPLYKRKDGDGWTLSKENAAGNEDEKKKDGEPIRYGKDGKPSEANHGNITPDLKDKNGKKHHGGVTVAYAEQTVVLSLPALRRLRFPVDGKNGPDRDNAARTVLAALGLCAATLAAETGLDLRSRCLLWADEAPTWELLGKPGEPSERWHLDGNTAIELLKSAVAKAKGCGLLWCEEKVTLEPSGDLVKLVVQSQRLAVQQSGDSDNGSD